jgi:hypothetical protein
MTDKTDAIGAIIDIMKSCRDLPADCNEGELFAYAEALFEERPPKRLTSPAPQGRLFLGPGARAIVAQSQIDRHLRPRVGIP